MKANMHVVLLSNHMYRMIWVKVGAMLLKDLGKKLKLNRSSQVAPICSHLNPNKIIGQEIMQILKNSL